MASVPGRKRKSKKCRIRLSCILWTFLAFFGILIVGVNVLMVRYSDQNYNPTSESVIQKQLSGSSGITSDPLLRILVRANVTITPDVRRRLPRYDQVIDRFDANPVIVGLETCADFNKKVSFEHRIVAPAGTFNSGTNLVFQHLEANCRLRKNHRGRNLGVDWQVNWGKHQPPRFRMDNSVHGKINNLHILPIVMVRDPWTWMQAMCRVRYSAHWFHVVPHPHDKSLPYHCPNLIPNAVDYEWLSKSKQFVRRYYDKDPWKVDNVLDTANFSLKSEVVPLRTRYNSGNLYHESLAHMWKDWYQEYYEADFPRLMVRLEDLVFRPQTVLKTICECVGGKLVAENEMSFVASSAKGGEGGEHIHGKNQTTLVDAMVSHIYSNRTKGMTEEDILYAKQVLDSSVMKKLGYKHPV